MAYWIINTAIIAGIFLIIVKIVRPGLKKKRAAKTLEEIFFPNGESQKNKMILTFRKIIQRQFTEEEILDFFIKEKGIQLMSINTDFPTSLKKYLMRPTLIELNYFEKVKFHETFINYSRNFKFVNIENSETIFENLSKKKVSAFITKKGYAS